MGERERVRERQREMGRERGGEGEGERKREVQTLPIFLQAPLEVASCCFRLAFAPPPGDCALALAELRLGDSNLLGDRKRLLACVGCAGLLFMPGVPCEKHKRQVKQGCPWFPEERHLTECNVFPEERDCRRNT